jgi:hypothetical protein
MFPKEAALLVGRCLRKTNHKEAEEGLNRASTVLQHNPIMLAAKSNTPHRVECNWMCVILSAHKAQQTSQVSLNG